MAVLIEMISVVILKNSIESKLSSDNYIKLMEYVLYNSSCMDDDILCIHINSSISINDFIDFSKQCNLELGTDFIIIDQNNGPIIECNWIQVGKFGKKLFKNFEDDMEITICSFFDGPQNLGHGFYLSDINNFKVYFPREWEYEGSMSQNQKIIS